MNSDILLERIEELIAKINQVQALSAVGLKGKPFPDERIASLHNSIGNAKHFIADETTAFNATEQFLSIKAAINELQRAGDDLFSLHQKGLVHHLRYHSLNRLIHEINELLRAIIDTEYT